MSKQRTVVVTKTGTPAYVGGIATARGEGETSSVIEHLLSRGDVDVVYFGSCRGHEDWEPYTSGKLTVMDPSMTGVFSGNRTPRESDAPKMMERIDPYVAELLERDIACWVDLTGPEVSWSWPDNAQFASTLLWSARYGGPAKYAMNKTGIAQDAPRFCVVTDPKCYPRDGEMVHGWPALVPKAVLSQETTQFPRSIQGLDSTVHTVYAGCEFWLTRGMEHVFVDKQWDTAIAANGHLTDGRVGGRGKNQQHDSPRYRTWTDVLSSLDPSTTRICGAGWDKHDFYLDEDRRQMFIGVLPDLAAVMQHIASGVSSPVLPQKRGFNTTKPRLHAMCGSVPCLYSGSEQTLVYDADCRILPEDHPARWVDGRPELTDTQVTDTIALVLEKTTPDFSKLDRLVDRALVGLREGEHKSPEWLSEFGGYSFRHL